MPLAARSGERRVLRVLILDGSRILVSLVRRLAPGPVELEEVAAFDEALARLRDDPPDALIVNVSPADLPWRQLKALCEDHTPKIPVLFESCVHESAIDAGIGDLNHSAAFLSKPYGLEQLRAELKRLFRSDQGTGRAAARAPHRAH